MAERYLTKLSFARPGVKTYSKKITELNQLFFYDYMFTSSSQNMVSTRKYHQIMPFF